MKNSKTKQTLENLSTIKYKLILEGIGVGFITGLLVSLFRLALTNAENLRGTLLKAAGSSTNALIEALCIFAVALAVTLIALKRQPMCSGSGIPQVKGELIGQMEQNWLGIIVAKFFGGIGAIGSGLSLGREGPSIQLGAMVGKGFSRMTNGLRTEEKLLMTCGAGAGLAGAFCAPLAGVVFTLEELHKNFSTEILLSTMAASVTSDFVASYIFGLSPVFGLHIEGKLPLTEYWMVILLGIILGIFGVFYNKMTEMLQVLYDKIPGKALKLAIPFAGAVVFAIWYPLVLGSGHFLVGRVANGEFAIDALAVLLILKFLFSTISFGSGAPGGIFLPLLVLGAVTGGTFAEFTCEITGHTDSYIANFVILGMAGYFSAIVRSPITGVILITEMTGDFQNFLSLTIVALISYIVADLLHGKPIYDQLLARMLSKDSDYGTNEESGNHKVLMECDVYPGSRMDGKRIENMLLPKGCLVVSVQRDSKEVVPGGSTVLKGGDKLLIICAEKHMSSVEEKINNICKKIESGI